VLFWLWDPWTIGLPRALARGGGWRERSPASG
jgi:hypothetical protein